jgi:hypothetical protein
MEKIIQEFQGFSGSKIFKIKNNNRVFVRKLDNVERNIERYHVLKSNNVSIPEMFKIGKNYYDMEFIESIDIIKFISYYDIDLLLDFLKKTFTIFQHTSVPKNYVKIYEEKLSSYDFSLFVFEKNELIEKLPKVMPQTIYHGDLTLDNILYDVKRKKFFLIDPLTSVYDSYVFDLAKLNQDLTCGWFSRRKADEYQDRKSYLFKKLSETYSELNNNYVLILMLLRVLPYCNNDQDKNFLLKWINNLWI